MEFTFTQILILIITTVISIIAIRFTFSFDFNKYHKRKDEKMLSKLKNKCPHTSFKNINGELVVQSSFTSPPGRYDYICQKCGLQKLHIEDGEEESRIDYFVKNPKELEREEKEFEKLAKKADLI